MPRLPARWPRSTCPTARRGPADRPWRPDDARQRQPRPDLVTALVQGTIGGRPLPQREIDAMFLLLVVAGNETTRQAIALGVQALLHHRGQIAVLRSADDRGWRTALFSPRDTASPAMISCLRTPTSAPSPRPMEATASTDGRSSRHCPRSPAHLRTGRLTCCANRPSRQRVMARPTSHRGVGALTTAATRRGGAIVKTCGSTSRPGTLLECGHDACHVLFIS